MTFNFTMSFSKSNLDAPWFLQWSTFILKQPSHKFCKRHLLVASVLRYKVHFDIQKLTIKFDNAFVEFASRLSRLHTCVFDACGLSEPSHESCTSSLSNLCLAFVFFTSAFWNCQPLRCLLRVHFQKPSAILTSPFRLSQPF